MLESTDPELANIFKEIWEKEAFKLKPIKGKNIPLLNLKPLLNKEYSYEEEGTNQITDKSLVFDSERIGFPQSE